MDDRPLRWHDAPYWWVAAQIGEFLLVFWLYGLMPVTWPEQLRVVIGVGAVVVLLIGNGLFLRRRRERRRSGG
jgi:hypothetical protein